jgi:hypothetical protein
MLDLILDTTVQNRQILHLNDGLIMVNISGVIMEYFTDYLGKKALLCTCRDDTVRIDMIPFMRKYKPDEFDKWYEYWYLARSSTSLTSKSLLIDYYQ